MQFRVGGFRGCMGGAYGCHVDPEGESVGATALEGKVIGVHGEGLAGVVAGLVGVLVVHVVGNADFGEDARVGAHVVDAFFSDRCELVSQAVSDGGFAYFDRKCWR